MYEPDTKTYYLCDDIIKSKGDVNEKTSCMIEIAFGECDSKSLYNAITDCYLPALSPTVVLLLCG